MHALFKSQTLGIYSLLPSIPNLSCMVCNLITFCCTSEIVFFYIIFIFHKFVIYLSYKKKKKKSSVVLKIDSN